MYSSACRLAAKPARFGRVNRRAACVVLSALASAAAARADGDSSGDLERMRGAFRLGPSMAADDAWWMTARAFTNMDTMDGVRPVFGGGENAEGGGFSWSTPRRGPISNPDAAGAFDSPLQPLVNPVRNGLAALRDVGIRADVYEALTFGAASDTIAGSRSSFGTGRFNARIDVLLFREEGEGIGRFTAQVRQNNFWPGDEGDVSASTGSSVYLNALRGFYDTSITRCSYAQSFADDRVVVTAGKINPGDFSALNIFASDEATQFMGLIFDGNDALPVPYLSYTPGVAVQALALDWLYLSGIVGSADGATDTGLDVDLERGMFAAAEASVLFEWLGMPGRVGATWVGSTVGSAELADPALPEIWGNALFVCGQYFVVEHVGVWAQYAAADEDVAALTQSELAFGVTVDDCFGRKGDGCGLAAGWAKPIDPSVQGEQFMIESYYRLQATGLSQVSLDLQMLAPSASSEVDDPTLVGTLRWVVRF